MNKIIGLMFGVLTIILAACEPIENRAVLSNSFDPDDIQLEVVQSTTGGNELSIRMNTPGIAGYWDYVIDKKFTDRVDVIFPIPGTSTFTFHVTTPYLQNNDITNVTYPSKSIDVTITQLDHELPEAYYKLVGDNLEGKTWVFDGGPEPDGGKWWYMVAGYNWQELWWNAAGDCCPPSDAAGRMVFDLDGGANYTYYPGAGEDGKVTGSKWAFNSDFSKLTLSGPANILGFTDGDGKVFEIKEFTDNRLTLFVSASGHGTGWVWKFKPAPAAK